MHKKHHFHRTSFDPSRNWLILLQWTTKSKVVKMTNDMSALRSYARQGYLRKRSSVVSYTSEA